MRARADGSRRDAATTIAPAPIHVCLADAQPRGYVETKMTRTQLEDLKARQIAFFEARLISDAAARQWREHLPAGWAAVLATPLGELVNAEALCRAIDAVARDGALRAAIRPAAAKALAELVAAARVERHRAGDLVSSDARATLDRLLERPKLVPEQLVREVLESAAIEAVMRDVLYDALKEFSEKVNPFFAEWGLPALLKRFAPFGAGALTKGMVSVRDEFERRLEPEIRKFLQGFSRTAMRETIDILLAKVDTPDFIALRKHVAAWVLAQEIGALARQLDEHGAALAQELGLDVAGLALQEEWLRKRQKDAVTAFLAAHGKEPVGEVLRTLGITLAPDFDVVAALSWPVVRSVCATAPVRGWLASLVAEFFDGVPDDAG
jgi:hypothetical protein